MEVWLKGNGGSIMLPIVPSEVGKNINAVLDSESIVKYGKISIFGGKEGGIVPLSSFFPAKINKHLTKNWQEPYSYVNIIEDWLRNGDVIRLIVTSTPINVAVRVSHFEYKDKISTGDVEYSIELKEHLSTKITEVHIDKENTNTNTNPNNNNGAIVTNRLRVTDYDPERYKKNYKVHNVKHGDDLIKIARKYYNNSKDYKKIKNNAENLKKYPSLKTSNIIYSNWELVIP